MPANLLQPHEYIYLGDKPIAMVRGGILYRVIADHLNTPRFILDAADKWVWRWSNADMFGAVAPEISSSGFEINLRFPGMYADSETGLFYNMNRYYNPQLGRYMEPDPIGLEGGLNPYEYAKGNPTMYTDPSGLLTELNNIDLSRSFANLQINQLNAAVNRQFDKFTSSTYRTLETGYYGATSWHFEMRSASNINLPTYEQTSKSENWVQLPASQSIYHDNGKGLPELKFVNSNGREAIYDGNTRNLVTDPRYAGTYNYVVPAPPPKSSDVLEWLDFTYRNTGHFILDVLPFYIGGNERGKD